MTTEEKFAAIETALRLTDRDTVAHVQAFRSLAELRQEMAMGKNAEATVQRMSVKIARDMNTIDELCALIAEAKLVSENDPNSDFGITAVKAEALAEYTKVCKKRNEELGEIRRLREALRQIQWGNDSIDYAGTVYNLCPLCDQSEVRGHSPDCLVGTALDAPKPEPCKWCADGKPEWSYDAKVWIHRRDRLDRVCENPPNNYGYTTQVPEETISGERRMEPCKRCGGTRSVRVKNRLTFDTDSAAERELAYDNVPCPNCQPDRRLFTFDRFEADSPVSDGIASARAASVAEALAKVQGEYPGSTFRLRGEE